MQNHIPDERLWQEAWQNCPIPVALVDVDGTFRSVDPAYCVMSGYSESELEGLTLFETISGPSDRKAATRESHKLASQKDREGFVLVASTTGKTSETSRSLLSVTAVRNEADELECLLVFLQPLSDSHSYSLEESGDGDAYLRAHISLRAIWNENRKACVFFFICCFALARAIDLAVFSSIVTKLQALFLTATPP